MRPLLYFLATACCLAQPGFAQTEASVNQPAADSLCQLPAVVLAPVVGFDSEAAYQRSIDLEVTELANLAQRSKDPVTQADLLLAAANLILARQLEPSCTCALIGTADPMDSAAVSEILKKAEGLLAQANEALAKARKQENLPEGWLEAALLRRETLSTFADGLRTYLLAGKGDDGQRERRRAASSLSVLLEDGNRAVAAAATLWQACLRSQGSDVKRVLTMLPLPLQEPEKGTLPFSFFARLLRCRLIAGDGGHAAALALLLQMEERMGSWLTSEADADDALRAIAFLEMQILRDWHDQLPAGRGDEERRWCATRIKILTSERFPEGQDSLLRLGTAIPIIAKPPGGTQ